MSRIDVEDLFPLELTSTEFDYPESMTDHFFHLLEQLLLSDHSLQRSRSLIHIRRLDRFSAGRLATWPQIGCQS